MTDRTERDATILRLSGQSVPRSEIMQQLGVTKSVVDNVRKAARLRAEGALDAAPLARIDGMQILPPDPIDRSGFAARINGAWRESVLAIFETGRLIAAAKQALPHGEFLAMVDEDLSFGARTAQMLMRIAEDERLRNAKHVSHLPPSWGTLYELTKLDDGTLAEKFSDGTIRPDMERRDIAQVRKATARAVREELLGRTIQALPARKFGVIVCDDEWDHAVWSRTTGMDRHASNHYETADDAHTAAELHERTRERFDCAADNCFLAMWATVQHLAIAIDLMRLRGFRYVSHYVWGKDKIGLGYWNRNKHEILLIGIKGDIPCPAPGTQWESLIMAPRGEHSAKPQIFLEMIERYFPTLPKIELNRRGPARPGWSAWGNEVESESVPKVLDGSSLDAGKAGTTASSRETEPARTSRALHSEIAVGSEVLPHHATTFGSVDGHGGDASPSPPTPPPPQDAGPCPAFLLREQPERSAAA